MTTGVGSFEELTTHERTYTRVETSIPYRVGMSTGIGPTVLV
jgi:hypothetical protein